MSLSPLSLSLFPHSAFCAPSLSSLLPITAALQNFCSKLKAGTQKCFPCEREMLSESSLPLPMAKVRVSAAAEITATKTKARTTTTEGSRIIKIHFYSPGNCAASLPLPLPLPLLGYSNHPAQKKDLLKHSKRVGRVVGRYGVLMLLLLGWRCRNV